MRVAQILRGGGKVRSPPRPLASYATSPAGRQPTRENEPIADEPDWPISARADDLAVRAASRLPFAWLWKSDQLSDAGDRRAERQMPVTQGEQPKEQDEGGTKQAAVTSRGHAWILRRG